MSENWITNIPKEGEHINAGDPIFSIYLSAPSESELISKLRENISISTYEDHRMAMAFAPLSQLMDIVIEDPSVVNKSYPHFWKDVNKI